MLRIYVSPAQLLDYSQQKYHASDEKRVGHKFSYVKYLPRAFS